MEADTQGGTARRWRQMHNNAHGGGGGRHRGWHSEEVYLGFELAKSLVGFLLECVLLQCDACCEILLNECLGKVMLHHNEINHSPPCTVGVAQYVLIVRSLCSHCAITVLYSLSPHTEHCTRLQDIDPSVHWYSASLSHSQSRDQKESEGEVSGGGWRKGRQQRRKGKTGAYSENTAAAKYEEN